MQRCSGLLARPGRVAAFDDVTLDALTLVHGWTLNEAHDSRHPCCGSIVLGDNNGVSGVSGKRGCAAKFEAANSQYLDAGGSEISRNKTILSFSMWVYISSWTGSNQVLVWEDTDSADDDRMMIILQTSTKKLYIRARDTSAGAPFGYTSTNTLSTGTWYHIAVCFDTVANSFKAWINNSLEIDQAPVIGNFYNAASAHGFSVGATGSGAALLDGYIDELYVWEQAIGAAEVAALYNAGSGTFYQPPGIGSPLQRPPKYNRIPRVPIRSWLNPSLGYELPLPLHVQAEPLHRLFPRRRLFGRTRGGILDKPAFRGKHYLNARGLYRVFGAAEYRFYRSSSAPPVEGSTPFATSSILPHTPADTYGDGTWYLSVSYFNGIYDSGFLAIGNEGQTYLRLDISGGESVDTPPAGPLDWRLEAEASGVVRVIACYAQTGNLRADTWAIAYTTDGSTPAEDAPDVTVAMTAAGFAILSYDLPAQAHGTTVKVRLQTRRDGTAYSEDSEVQTITADAQGPSAPDALAAWRGVLPES